MIDFLLGVATGGLVTTWGLTFAQLHRLATKRSDQK